MKLFFIILMMLIMSETLSGCTNTSGADLMSVSTSQDSNQHPELIASKMISPITHAGC